MRQHKVEGRGSWHQHWINVNDRWRSLNHSKPYQVRKQRAQSEGVALKLSYSSLLWRTRAVGLPYSFQQNGPMTPKNKKTTTTHMQSSHVVLVSPKTRIAPQDSWGFSIRIPAEPTTFASQHRRPKDSRERTRKHRSASLFSVIFLFRDQCRHFIWETNWLSSKATRPSLQTWSIYWPWWAESAFLNWILKYMQL